MAVQFENFYESTLSGPITDTDLVIPINTPPTVTEGWLLLDYDVPSKREFIYYTSRDATTVTCPADGRGKDGTTAIAHTQNAKVRMNVNAGILEGLRDGDALTPEFTANYDPSNPTLETQKWVGVASAVNEITITNAASGNFPTISATGQADTGIDFENSEGEEILKLDAVASAVNELTITNAATGARPFIQASGGDTNISWRALAKGTGTFQPGRPISFGAYRNTNQSVPTATETRVDINTLQWGETSWFDTASGNFSAPFDGRYIFEGGIVFDAMGSDKRVILYLAVNGSVVRTFGLGHTGAASGGDYGVAGSCEYQLSAGDDVTLRVFHDNGSNRELVGTASNTWFSGHLLGVI